MAKTSRIIRLLMERDGLSYEEAREQVEEVQEMIIDAIENGDFLEPDEIMADELGLEPDYIMDLVF